MSSLSSIMSKRRWNEWCNQEVIHDNSEYVKRKYLILELAAEGLIPFLKKNGYVLGCDYKRLAECIARSLYFKKTSHEALNYEYRDEDYERYYHVLDDDTWSEFWEGWGNWCDVDENSVSAKEGIRFCVWTLLDLYNSPQTTVVDDILGLNETENAVDTRDPYLIDSANGFFSEI